VRLVVDSNIFISSLDPEDIFHNECYPIFEKMLNFDIEVFCPILILIEVTCVIQRRTKSEKLSTKAYQYLSNLPSLNWLDVTLEVAERASILCSKTGLRGGDAIVMQVAEQYGIPIITKDKEFKEKSPEGILIVEPSELKF